MKGILHIVIVLPWNNSPISCAMSCKVLYTAFNETDGDQCSSAMLCVPLVFGAGFVECLRYSVRFKYNGHHPLHNQAGLSPCMNQLQVWSGSGCNPTTDVQLLLATRIDRTSAALMQECWLAHRVWMMQELFWVGWPEGMLIGEGWKLPSQSLAVRLAWICAC